MNPISLEEIEQARERNRVITEGAGAASVAAALSGKGGTGRVVCVVSGGNIDLPKLVKILHGEIP
jgi:threonine dehydratase